MAARGELVEAEEKGATDKIQQLRTGGEIEIGR